jgi:hypothetical protein
MTEPISPQRSLDYFEDWLQATTSIYSPNLHDIHGLWGSLEAVFGADPEACQWLWSGLTFDSVVGRE